MPRFSLRILLLSVPLVGIIVFVLLRGYVAFRGNFDPFSRQIRNVNKIYDVQVLGDWEEGTRDVEVLTFRIKGKPTSFVELWNPDCDLFIDSKYAGLRQIGDLRLYISLKDSATGYSGGGCVDIGPNSRLSEILPFSIESLEELISRYDDVYDYFQSWPQYPTHGQLKISASQCVEYGIE